MKLYDFFKYIFFKLKGYEFMNEINPEELEEFMVHTLWEIQSKINNNEQINEMLFIKEENEALIDEINYDKISYNLIQIKEVIDNYIDTKLNVSKSSDKKLFKLRSYEIRGMEDIKYITDYKTFESYNQINNDYDIKIIYETNELYTITIEEIYVSNKNIQEPLGKIYQEIINRSVERKAILLDVKS